MIGINLFGSCLSVLYSFFLALLWINKRFLHLVLYLLYWIFNYNFCILSVLVVALAITIFTYSIYHP